MNPAEGVETVGEPRIPELRKREERERRGGGLFWTSASPQAGLSLLRAPPGSPSGPFGLGRWAASLAGRLGAGSVLGRLLASRAGGWLLLSWLLGVGGVIGGAAGLQLARLNRAVPRETLVALAPPSPEVVRRGPRDRSLAYVREANQGELVFGGRDAPGLELDAKPADLSSTDPPGEASAEPSADANPVPENAGAPEAQAIARSGALGDMRDAMANGAVRYSLSAPFGAGAGAAAGAGRVPGAALPLADRERGGLAAPRRGRRAARADGLRSTAGRASRAMGQLKLAQFMSRQAPGRPHEEAASQVATNAFEQSKTQGGELPVIGAGPGFPAGVVVPPGTGAPDITKPDLGEPPEPPPVGPPANVTPYQKALDAARNMAKAAGKLRMMGILMMVAGAALVASGWWPTVIVGLAMIAMGIMMLAAAQNLAGQAKAIAKGIAAFQDQVEQAQIAADFAKAKADGRAYTPPDLSDKTKRNDGVRQAVDEERNAGYTFPTEPER